jgi:hypothetical protein
MEVVEKVTCWLKRTYPKGASKPFYVVGYSVDRSGEAAQIPDLFRVV